MNNEFKKVLTIDGANLDELKTLDAISNNIRGKRNSLSKIAEDKMRPLQEAFNRIATEANKEIDPLNEEYQKAEKDFWDQVYSMYPEIERGTPVRMDRATLGDVDSIDLEEMVIPTTTTEVENNVVNLNADKVAEATEKAGV